mgnify:FL=1
MNELIEKANADWDALHPDEGERLAPLIRLRVRPRFATYLVPC